MWSRSHLVLGTLMLNGSCGGHVGYDPNSSTTGNQAAGGESSTSIATPSNTSTGGATEPGEATGTGGASTVDMAYCDGIFAGQNCGNFHTSIASENATCIVPLQSPPPSLYRTVLALDCDPIPLTANEPLDGATGNGFFIDYAREPATLVLVGSACDTLHKPGNHTLDLIVGCATFN